MHKKILFDANAIIELHQLSLWQSVLDACHAAVTPIIRHESIFYRDNQGQKRAIDLTRDIEDRKIEEIPVSIEVFDVLHGELSDTFLQGVDDGEREAIAFLYSIQNSSYLFCTSDQFAIKCLGVLDLSQQGISLQHLLEECHIQAVPRLHIHSKELFNKLLLKGIHEAHLHRR